MFSFHSLKAFPGLIELPGDSTRSEVMEGVGARTTELCQSWDTMTPCEQTCLARCWAGDRAILQLNIAAFNSDVPPQSGDCCCRTDILEASLLLGSCTSISLWLHQCHVMHQ